MLTCLNVRSEPFNLIMKLTNCSASSVSAQHNLYIYLASPGGSTWRALQFTKYLTCSTSEQDATMNNLLTNATSSSVIILLYVCCIQTVIDVCTSCVLSTFNKDDDDDDAGMCSTMPRTLCLDNTVKHNLQPHNLWLCVLNC